MPPLSEKQALIDPEKECRAQSASPIRPASLTSSLGSLVLAPFSCLPSFLPRPSTPEIDVSSEQPLDYLPLPDLPRSAKVAPNGMLAAAKLTKLRLQMKRHGITVYLVPSEDEHQSEYTSLADKRREFLCEFTGSAGICVVSLTDPETLSGNAALSTDGRYFLQAENELDPSLWSLLKQGAKGFPTWQQFAIREAKKSTFSNVISCDPRLLSLLAGEAFEAAQSSGGFVFKPFIGSNLVDDVWGSEKPQRSLDPVYELALEYSGATAQSKIERVRAKLRETNRTHLVVTALDDIGWLFNLRADTDIPFSPFFYAYCVVDLNEVTLYGEKSKFEKVLPGLCKIRGFSLKDYGLFYQDLAQLQTTVKEPNLSIVLPDKDACNYALKDSIPDSVAKRTIYHSSVILVMKLFKNATELRNARIAQSKDALAFIIHAAWLENQLVHRKVELTEYQAAQKIYAIRQDLPNFKGLSYETISSTGPNAAIIHYEPTETECSVIDPATPYLLDSGAHYLEGTTDITRTYMFSAEGVTDRYRKFYTLVLKGHLAVAVAKFAAGSTRTGLILDAYARQPLWNEGLDFNHGTGHGVGSFGNVHEGPLYILTTAGGSSEKDYFRKGAIVTDEPGFYVDGECGFRIESELEVCECGWDFGKTRSGGKYLEFNYLTKVPFCNKLIDPRYLTPLEITWINDYHRNIRAEYGPKLLEMGELRAFAWLAKETAAI